MDDGDRVRQAIWEWLPELRESFEKFDQERKQDLLEKGIEPYVGPYALVTQVFVEPYFVPLLDDANSDEAALERCAGMIEYILEARSSLLDDLVGIRVVEHMLGWPERWRKFRQYAGPLLKDQVRLSSQYFTWPYDDPVV